MTSQEATTGANPFYGVNYVDDPAKYQNVRVRVIRPFCVAGKRIEAGEIVEVQRGDALGLQHSGKAVIV